MTIRLRRTPARRAWIGNPATRVVPDRRAKLRRRAERRDWKEELGGG